MNKKDIKVIRHIIYDWLKYGKNWDEKYKEHQEILKILFHHLFSDSNTWERNYNKTDNEVFWKINEEFKERIFKYIDWERLNGKTQNEVEYFWLKVIDLLSSIYEGVPNIKNKNIETKIGEEMNIWWQALERLIIYSVKKFCSNTNLDIQKAKAEYEWNKIDFISTYYIKWKKIKVNFANQLTMWSLNIKKQELDNLAYFLDNPSYEKSKTKIQFLNKNNFRVYDLPDLPILFSIQNWLQRVCRSNEFNNSYKEIWKKNIIEIVGKNKQDKEINNHLLVSIWVSYSSLIEYFIKQIQKINLNEEYHDSNKNIWEWESDVYYNPENNIFKISFLKDNKTSYILYFYITDKFLVKIWINWNINKRNYSKIEK